MFRRLIHEPWQDWVPVLAFLLTFAVFIVAFIRAMLLKKESVAHMATLPLDEVMPVHLGHGPGDTADSAVRPAPSPAAADGRTDTDTDTDDVAADTDLDDASGTACSKTCSRCVACRHQGEAAHVHL